MDKIKFAEQENSPQIVPFTSFHPQLNLQNKSLT